jgi:hypothetical protein
MMTPLPPANQRHDNKPTSTTTTTPSILLQSQVLHDAFFKYQKKPSLSLHGDVYYEGKEFEVRS